MKRLPILIICALFLAACSNKLDKKVDVKTAKEDIEYLKKEYADEYTAEDFDQIGNQLAGKALAAVFTGSKAEDIKDNLKIDKTYREILDSAKSKRLVFAEKLKTFEADSAKFNKLITIKVDTSAFYERSDFEHYYLVNYSGKNNSGKEIAAFDAGIVFSDALDNTLLNISAERLDPLKVDETFKKEGTFALNSFDAGFNTLQTQPFSKFKTRVELNKIVFKDGTKLEAPSRPTK